MMPSKTSPWTWFVCLCNSGCAWGRSETPTVNHSTVVTGDRMTFRASCRFLWCLWEMSQAPGTCSCRPSILFLNNIYNTHNLCGFLPAMRVSVKPPPCCASVSACPRVLLLIMTAWGEMSSGVVRSVFLTSHCDSSNAFISAYLQNKFPGFFLLPR